MSIYPLAAPPSRVVRMEEGDERLLAIKGAIHDFVSSSCTTRKKWTEAERGRERRSALRTQSYSHKGSGLDRLLTSSTILTAAWASMAINSVSESTSDSQTVHRMKCWATVKQASRIIRDPHMTSAAGGVRGPLGLATRLRGIFNKTWAVLDLLF